LLSLIHVVEWRASVTGDHIALSDHLGGELSYAALAAQTELSAARFAAAEIAPGDVVPILARNQVGWVTAMLGLIRLGALPAAVNWRLSAGEVTGPLELMNAGAQFPAILTDADREPLARDALVGLGGSKPALSRWPRRQGRRIRRTSCSDRSSGCGGPSPACCCTPAAPPARRSWCR
jgi:acyl-CoA synthetase (AMP-forming)/AMP-acid ligase II